MSFAHSSHRCVKLWSYSSTPFPLLLFTCCIPLQVLRVPLCWDFSVVHRLGTGCVVMLGPTWIGSSSFSYLVLHHKTYRLTSWFGLHVWTLSLKDEYEGPYTHFSQKWGLLDIPSYSRLAISRCLPTYHVYNAARFWVFIGVPLLRCWDKCDWLSPVVSTTSLWGILCCCK